MDTSLRAEKISQVSPAWTVAVRVQPIGSPGCVLDGGPVEIMPCRLEGCGGEAEPTANNVASKARDNSILENISLLRLGLCRRATDKGRGSISLPL